MNSLVWERKDACIGWRGGRRGREKVWACMLKYAHVCLQMCPRLMSRVLFNLFSPLYRGSVSHLKPELTELASLASHCTLETPSLPSHALGFRTAFDNCPGFTWSLRIWPPVFMLAQQRLYPLSHASILKKVFEEYLLSQLCPTQLIPSCPIFGNLIVNCA